jgi:hypothetical protein
VKMSLHVVPFDISRMSSLLLDFQEKKERAESAGVSHEFKAQAKRLKPLVTEYLTTHPGLNLEAELERIKEVYGKKVAKKVEEWSRSEGDGSTKVKYTSHLDAPSTEIFSNASACGMAAAMQEAFTRQETNPVYEAMRAAKKACKAEVRAALRTMAPDTLKEALSAQAPRLTEKTLGKITYWAVKA